MSEGKPVGGAAGISLRHRPRPVEFGIKLLLILAATVSVVTTISIVVSLVPNTISFFQQVSPWDFLTGTRWTPTLAPKAYGVLPILTATLMATLIAMVVAVPIGLGSAIYLAEYASDRARRIIKPILEVLAGIPTVVYGFFAVFALGPLLRDLAESDYQNLVIAGVAMGFMIVPTVASISEDAMSAVPRSLREGAYALASSKMQVATRIVVPAAMSGIVAAFVLGTSRAIGETMIVTMAGGLRSDAVSLNPLDGRATITAFIANISRGDLPVESFDYKTIFVAGALLFVFTFILNAVSIRLVRRFREVYE